MNWTELLKSEIEDTYRVTQALIDLVEPGDSLDWKPATGSNWMTMGQLLRHLTDACGSAFKGFVTGNWGIPQDVDLSAEDMLSPAELLPTIGSVAEAKRLLAEDEQLSYDMLARCAEDELANKVVPAPWYPQGMILGRDLLHMVDHLRNHKAQLFYYLKLQGKPVNTGNLWGM
ncbi:MAG: DinB family protein [Anaerolineae bacterium]|nr:DinB family protein [Anaerolineae bacterium]